MNQNFDQFDSPEMPIIILCNPDKSQLYSMSLGYDTKIVKRFNALSEFSFNFPKSINGGITNVEGYDYINNKRLISVEGYGYFLITNVQENLDGAIPIKEVTCESLESELIQKRVTVFGGTKPLWDILSPNDVVLPNGTHVTTILYDMIQRAPNWTVGSVDAVLLTKYRTFDVSDTNVYNFLMNDVSKAFDLVFEFDTDLRTISALAVQNATSTSDIFLSFDNIIKTASFSEKSDEIITCLSVYGGGDLNIRAVNPLGTDKIYDFSYYKNTSWMSQSLVDAITTWENLVLSYQTPYANQLTLLRGYNLELILKNSELDALVTAHDVLETQKKVAIQTNASLVAVNASLLANENTQTAKRVEITNAQSQVTSATASLVVINNTVSFTVNFTPTQLLELDNFIYQNTYKNENIIQTDSMTDVEIQDASQSLYDQALTVLDKVSQPRYEIEIDAINYIALPEFSTFTNQTELGTVITCEISPDVFIETVLLELEMTFDNPENFSILLSNRVRKDGAGFKYSDLMGQVVKTGSSVAFDNYKWSNWESTYKSDVSTFITSALNTATNNLINNANQEILINGAGLRGRTYNTSTGTYDDTQVWLTSSVLAFSDNGFQTSKLALGSISTTAGVKFGLIADVIVGTMLAGTTLTITNSGGNFTLNETGATLYNAKFTIENSNSRILLNPNDSDGRIFRIQKNESTIWTDKFWVDNTGNVNFSGNLSGATGTFSGSLSAATGSFSGDITGASGTFSGTIRADRLLGAVSYTQLTDIPAEKITSGSMSQARVGSGYPAYKVGSGDMSYVRLTFGSAVIGNGTSGGSLYLEAPSGTVISGGLSVVNGGLSVGGSTVATQFYVTSRGYITGTIGSNVTGLKLRTGYSGGASYANLNFSNGLMTSFTYSGT